MSYGESVCILYFVGFALWGWSMCDVFPPLYPYWVGGEYPEQQDDLYAISPRCAGAFAVLSISSDMVYNVGINLKCNYGWKVYGGTIHMVEFYIIKIYCKYIP